MNGFSKELIHQQQQLWQGYRRQSIKRPPLRCWFPRLPTTKRSKSRTLFSQTSGRIMCCIAEAMVADILPLKTESLAAATATMVSALVMLSPCNVREPILSYKTSCILNTQSEGHHLHWIQQVAYQEQGEQHHCKTTSLFPSG